MHACEAMRDGACDFDNGGLFWGGAIFGRICLLQILDCWSDFLGICDFLDGILGDVWRILGVIFAGFVEGF